MPSPFHVSGFPHSGDLRNTLGGECFCAIGTLGRYPHAWWYRVRGEDFENEWSWLNDIFGLPPDTQAVIDNEPRGCTWRWEHPAIPFVLRSVTITISDLNPAPPPPNTIGLQIHAVMRDPDDPGGLVGVTGEIKYWENPDPRVYPTVKFLIIAHSGPDPGANAGLIVAPRHDCWIPPPE